MNPKRNLDPQRPVQTTVTTQPQPEPTNNRNKIIVIVAVIVLLLIGGALFALFQNQAKAPAEDEREATTTQTTAKTQTTTPNQPSSVATSTSNLAAGRYEDYASSKLSEKGYDQTILFFHAAWCPECRANDSVIKQNIPKLPAGTQVLKVDYDSATDLKKKYGVTTQTTFVRVDSDGNLQKKWQGYGQTKTIDAILNGVK